MADQRENDRFERGMDIFRSLNPAAVEVLQKNLGEIAPDLMRYVAEFPFGDLYARQALIPAIRQTVTLTTLACGGHTAQLKIHIQIALNMGMSRDELVEIFMQMAPYAGFPVAINAVMALKEVLDNTTTNSDTQE